jgi:hypothetical protein
MGGAQSTSSYRSIRNQARKCSAEGCTRRVTRDGSRGLCGVCYRRVTSTEKKQGQKTKKAITEVERHCAVRDPEIVGNLPRRRNFEWLGDLQSSVKNMQAEESSDGK